jgi:hypothetical protein
LLHATSSLVIIKYDINRLPSILSTMGQISFGWSSSHPQHWSPYGGYDFNTIIFHFINKQSNIVSFILLLNIVMGSSKNLVGSDFVAILSNNSVCLLLHWKEPWSSFWNALFLQE